MKKNLFAFALMLTLPMFLFAEDFVSCTENADESYSGEEQSLKDAHEDEVSDLEKAKDIAVKDAFHIMSIRSSFTKMKALRAEYKAKIVESEILFKKNLEALSQKHDEKVMLCTFEKKRMDDASDR